MQTSPTERFFSKVDQSAGPNGCWPWIGHRLKTGYGTIKRAGKVELAHRVSYQIHTGEIPAGMIVMHTCDNPCCVSPFHLILGTSKDNSQDCINKQRQARGEKNGIAKLTAGQVEEIRKTYNKTAGRTLRYLAQQFGMGTTQVWNIVHGLTWRHV